MAGPRGAWAGRAWIPGPGTPRPAGGDGQGVGEFTALGGAGFLPARPCPGTALREALGRSQPVLAPHPGAAATPQPAPRSAAADTHAARPVLRAPRAGPGRGLRGAGPERGGAGATRGLGERGGGSAWAGPMGGASVGGERERARGWAGPGRDRAGTKWGLRSRGGAGPGRALGRGLGGTGTGRPVASDRREGRGLGGAL